MSEYRKAITEKVKENMNSWIETLKKEHPQLLLTKQWQVLFPKGFNEGYNALSVVTGSKKGKRLVAEVEFVLPSDLELDFDDLELVLKNEPFIEKRPKAKKAALVPVDETIDILNNIVSGVNSFLSDLNINIPTSPSFTALNLTEMQQPPTVQPSLSTRPQILDKEAAPPLKMTDENLVEKLKREMVKSEHFPDWLKTIESKEVFKTLMQKLAEGFIHYQQKLGSPVELKDFFQKYEEHLKENNKLYYHCKYKGKPITHDSNGWCTEGYCSKKPYRSTCSYNTLKFGTPT